MYYDEDWIDEHGQYHFGTEAPGEGLDEPWIHEDHEHLMEIELEW